MTDTPEQMASYYAQRVQRLLDRIEDGQRAIRLPDVFLLRSVLAYFDARAWEGYCEEAKEGRGHCLGSQCNGCVEVDSDVAPDMGCWECQGTGMATLNPDEEPGSHICTTEQADPPCPERGEPA